MAKASIEALEKLHAKVAEILMEALERARDSEDGVQASLIAAATKFLKDNHIEAALGGGDLDALKAQLGVLQSVPYDGEVPEEYRTQ